VVGSACAAPAGRDTSPITTTAVAGGGYKSVNEAVPATGAPTKSEVTWMFDGKDHPVTGAQQGLTASGRRRGERAMEVVDKIAGKGLDSQAFELSRDGKTLTMNVHRAGQATPDVLVFERE